MEAEVIPFQVDQKQGGQAVGILSGLQTPYDHPAVRLSEDRAKAGQTDHAPWAGRKLCLWDE